MQTGNPPPMIATSTMFGSDARLERRRLRGAPERLIDHASGGQMEEEVADSGS